MLSTNVGFGRTSTCLIIVGFDAWISETDDLKVTSQVLMIYAIRPAFSAHTIKKYLFISHNDIVSIRF